MPIDPERLPTWSEFLFLAKKQGIRIVERDLKIASPTGPEPPIRYLQRPGGPQVIVPPLRLGDIVRENLLSSLCRTLAIDPKPLGIAPDELLPLDWP
jgi:hypothetical protein